MVWNKLSKLFSSVLYEYLVLLYLGLLFSLYILIPFYLFVFCICFQLMQLGGLNSVLAIEHSPSIPIVSKAPTIILGMDVSHGSPGQSDVPSIAAVSILCW